MSKETDASRIHVPERVGMDEIASMPALLDTVQAAQIVGTTPLAIARDCAKGTYKAVKCGRAWRINKAAFLTTVGLA